MALHPPPTASHRMLGFLRRAPRIGRSVRGFYTAAQYAAEDEECRLFIDASPSEPLPPGGTRARTQWALGLVEARVQELAPGIDQRGGLHANRALLFGGAKPDLSEALLLRGNDYLQLKAHPDVTAAKAEALHSEGSRPHLHRAFEQRMAVLLGVEEAVLTMSGAHAVRGLVETLCGGRRGVATPVYADAYSWAARPPAGSLRHSLEASVTPFAHNDPAALRRLASRAPGVVVVDGVYGQNGAVARLPELVDVAEETGCVVVVDETHSFGATAGGLGVCEEFGVGERVHFRAVGLSKAFASRGGVVLGPARPLEAFRFVDGQIIFSTPPREHEVVGYEATLDVLLRDEWRRDALRRNHAQLKAGLLALGYADAVAQSDRQILSIVTGDAPRTAALRDFCAQHGVFGSVFVPPAAHEGRSFLRFTVHSGMDGADIDRFLHVMAAARPVLRKDWHGAI